MLYCSAQPRQRVGSIPTVLRLHVVKYLEAGIVDVTDFLITVCFPVPVAVSIDSTYKR